MNSLSTRLLSAAVVLSMAVTTLAGDAVKLAVEVPSDGRVLVPGERVAVQVVGIDAEGNRVGLGGRDAVVGASVGEVEVVKRPYEFAYVAPARVTGGVDVTLTAHLQGAQSVRGEASVRVVPRGRFVRLVLTTEAATAPFGSKTAIRVRGELRDGSLAALGEKVVDFDLRGEQRGRSPGVVQPRRDGIYEYIAPPAAAGPRVGTSVSIYATLRGHDGVGGELSLKLAAAGDKPVPPAPPSGERGGERGAERGDEDGTGETAPPSAGEKGTETTDPAGTDTDTDTDMDTAEIERDADADTPGVLWTGDALRVTAWRFRAGPNEDWSRKSAGLPPAGAEFVAPGHQQGIRLRVEHRDVTGVILHWWVGKRGPKNVRRETGEEGGAVLTVKKVRRRTFVILTPTVPNRARVTMRVTLKRGKGKAVHTDFIARRGKLGSGAGVGADTPTGDAAAKFEPLEWTRNHWDETLAKAKRAGASALIGFTEPGNVNASALEAVIRGDADIQEELARFKRALVAVSDENDEKRARARLARMRREFGTTTVPLHVIVDGSGKELARFEWSATVTGKDYLTFLRSVR